MRFDRSQRLSALWIFFGFVFWVFAFRGFLSSKLALISDATPYYDHTKFFIENLSRGVYALWDPYWFDGSPNDFFLRRIGALNPFYLIILVFKTLGVPYTLSYLWFLALYYWGGAIAFYLLAMRIYQDRLMAYAGYLMLLFSSLGTRLFDSYLMLVTVALLWFFYFLISFVQTPRKHSFLGALLSFLILAGTYIPFYFLIILGLFLLVFCLVYFDLVPKIVRSCLDFYKKYPLFVLLSLLAIPFVFFPIISFYHASGHGQVVMPVRHGDAGAGNTLIVPRQTLDWGAVEDLMYSSYFSDLRLLKFAVVYVPFFSVVVLLLGLIGRITRRTVFMVLLGLVLSCCIVPYGFPFYDFFYQHLFFLKYFRNLHFFIWFFLIPLFILLVLEHWDMLMKIKLEKTRHQYLILVYIFFVHLAAFVFVWYRKDAVVSTYMMIFLSLIFWSLMVLRKVQDNVWGYALLTLVILVQPLEAYHYFSLKAKPYAGPYQYDANSLVFKFKDPDLVVSSQDSSNKAPLYYVSGRYDFIYQNLTNNALAEYLQHKIMLVDRIKYMSQDLLVPALENNYLTTPNMGIITGNDGEGLKLQGNDPNPPAHAQPIDADSKGFKVNAFDANHLKLTIDVPYDKFLIYNDTYDPHWKVSVNKAQARLYEVNGAFKGVWLSAGRNVVEFSYGSWWQYAMNVLLSLFALIFLLGIIGCALC